MSKYINADELKSNIPKDCYPEDYSIEELIDEMPSADVVEVKHGEWVHREDMDFIDQNGVEHFHCMCETCGFIHDFLDCHTEQYNFCPECGTDMRERKESKVKKCFDIPKEVAEMLLEDTERKDEVSG